MSSGTDQRVLPIRPDVLYPVLDMQKNLRAANESVQVPARDTCVDTGVDAVPASLTQGLPYPFYTPLDL